MKQRYISLICAVIFAGAQLCLAQQQTTGEARSQGQQAHSSAGAKPPDSTVAQQNQGAATPATSASAIPSYPDTPKGLEDLMKEMLRLQKKGDGNALAWYVNSLVLPNAGAWFRATFGDENGGELADSYARTRLELPLSFPDTLEQLSSKHLTHPRAVRFTDSCNADASETEYPLLLRRSTEQPLYDVRFFNGTTVTLLPYFAFVDGAFRYLGNFKVRAPDVQVMNSPGTRPEKKVKIPYGLLEGKLIKEITPVYPDAAKYSGIHGTVLLHALIDEHGKIADLQLLQGRCILATAAINAVRQWRYSPYEIGGQPVAVDTTITVIFNLGR